MARRRRWAGGAVLIAVAVAVTLADGLPTTSLEIVGAPSSPPPASSALLVVGSAVGSVSVDPLTLP